MIKFKGSAYFYRHYFFVQIDLLINLIIEKIYKNVDNSQMVYYSNYIGIVGN